MYVNHVRFVLQLLRNYQFRFDNYLSFNIISSDCFLHIIIFGSLPRFLRIFLQQFGRGQGLGPFPYKQADKLTFAVAICIIYQQANAWSSNRIKKHMYYFWLGLCGFLSQSVALVKHPLCCETVHSRTMCILFKPLP